MSKHRAPTTTCGVCRRPVDGAYLCRDDTTDLEQRLLDLPELAHALDAAYLKQQRFTVNSTSVQLTGHGDESPLPFQPAAGRLRRDLTRTLLRWVLLIHDRDAVPWQVGMPEYPTNTTRAMTGRLLWALPWLRTHTEGPDAALEVRALHEAILRVVDRPPDLVYLGECSMPGDFTVYGEKYTECPEDLYAERAAEYVTCRRCHHQHRVEDRRSRLLVAVKDQLANASDISRGLAGLDLKVTAERIRKWRERGRLVEHGRDRRGYPLYQVGEVVDLALDQNQEKSAS